MQARDKLAARYAEVIDLRTDKIINTTPEDAGGDPFIYVTEVWDESNPIPDGVLHTVRRGVFYGDHWLVYADQSSSSPSSTNTLEARGAVLNPSIQEGRYYRAFTLEEGESFLLRATGANRFDIISDGYGKAWTYENDSTSRQMLEHTSTHYLEVEAPVEVLPTVTLEGVGGPTPQLDRFRGYADLSKGLNPNLHPGEFYAVVSAAGSDAEVFVGQCQENGTLRRIGIHHAAAGWITETMVDLPDLVAGESMWAVLRYEEPLTEVTPESLLAVKTETQRVISETVTMNDVMNRIASDAGWCETYEDTIITPFGLEPREKEDEEDEEVDWTLTVTGTVQVRDSSPTSELDERLRDHYFPGISSEDLRFDTKFEIKILMEGYTDSSSAEEALTEEMVADALKGEMTSSHSVTLVSLDYDVDHFVKGNDLDD
jgi:hypothetical protein